MNQPKSICIFASSSEHLLAGYYDMARELGRDIVKAGMGLVFGGGRIGLMGAAARGAEDGNGHITGVIPEKLHRPGVAYPGCTKLIVTPTMHERKQTMETLADAFIALPGGFGTLEELLEVITLKQLGYHNKPIVLLNMDGFFDATLEQFERFFAEGFAHTESRALYTVAESAATAVAQVCNYTPPVIRDKVQDALEGADAV